MTHHFSLSLSDSIIAGPGMFESAADVPGRYAVSEIHVTHAIDYYEKIRNGVNDPTKEEVVALLIIHAAIGPYIKGRHFDPNAGRITKRPDGTIFVELKENNNVHVYQETKNPSNGHLTVYTDKGENSISFSALRDLRDKIESIYSPRQAPVVQQHSRMPYQPRPVSPNASNRRTVSSVPHNPRPVSPVRGAASEQSTTQAPYNPPGRSTTQAAPYSVQAHPYVSNPFALDVPPPGGSTTQAAPYSGGVAQVVSEQTTTDRGAAPVYPNPSAHGAALNKRGTEAAPYSYYRSQNFYIEDDTPSTCGPVGNAAMVKPRVTSTDIGDLAAHEPVTGYTLHISSVGEIDDFYRGFPSTLLQGSIPIPEPVVVVGVDAYMLGTSKHAKNSVIQAASQFNFLESMSTRYAPTTQYRGDPTQGPRTSLAVPGALMIRDNQFKDQDPQANFFFYGKVQGSYAGGYYMPSSDPHLRFRPYIFGDLGKLGILVQDGFDRHSMELVTQVFTAAPSYQSFTAPDENSVGGYLCRRFMMVQYEAVAKVAVIKKYLSGKPVNLHLTFVGAGAFNNNVSASADAVVNAAVLASKHGVQVYIHIYNKAQSKQFPMIKEVYDKEMTSQEFFA